MNLKKYKPTSPGLRGLVNIDFKKEDIWNGQPLKELVHRKQNKAGRNHKGQISTFHRGGGHKRLYRQLDFKRVIRDVQGEIVRIEYDPNRSAFISLVLFSNGLFSYFLASEGDTLGKPILISNSAPIISGNSLPLENIPLGTSIHSIEIKRNGGAQLVRSAGTFAKIIKRDSKFCTVRLNSGALYEIPSDCLATIGIVANINHKNVKIGKAGRSRWLNKRPTVRGVVMNPVDHPHGGGEGKTSGGRCSVTPWGIPTKGFKTRRKKKK